MDREVTAGRFDPGDVTLGSGEVLPGAVLTQHSYGILDPKRWFVVVPDMVGNGASSSPSNTPGYPALEPVNRLAS